MFTLGDEVVGVGEKAASNCNNFRGSSYPADNDGSRKGDESESQVNYGRLSCKSGVDGKLISSMES